LAFTLLELMVVLTLIAILSAAIIPEMRGSFEDTVLRSSARQLIDLVGVVNGRAVSLSQTHRVRYEPTAGRFVIESRSGRSTRNASFVAVRELARETRTLDPRVTVEIRRPPGATATTGAATRGSANEGISFYPDGTADAAEFLLSDRSGFGLALRLNPVTARVRVVERPRP